MRGMAIPGLTASLQLTQRYTPFQTKPDAAPVRLIVRPPGDGRQRGCGYGLDCSVAASIGCSLFPGGFLFQNHYPRFRGAPSSFFKGCPKGRPSVDSGLDAGPARSPLGHWIAS